MNLKVQKQDFNVISIQNTAQLSTLIDKSVKIHPAIFPKLQFSGHGLGYSRCDTMSEHFFWAWFKRSLIVSPRKRGPWYHVTSLKNDFFGHFLRNFSDMATTGKIPAWIF